MTASSSILARSPADQIETGYAPIERHRLLIWHWGRRGGGPLYTYELARSMNADPRFDVHLSISRESELADKFSELHLPTLWVDTYRGIASALWASRRLPRLRQWLRAYLRYHRIDTVLCTMPHLWNAGVVDVFRGSGTRLVTTIHDAKPHAGEPFRFPAFNLRRELRHADKVLTLTRYVRDSMLERYSVEDDRIEVIPHGIFGGENRPAQPRTRDRSRPLRLLFFGRILAYKGLSVLLDAFRRLNEAQEAVELTIAGAGDVSTHRKMLSELPNVTLINRWIESDEIIRLVREHDLMVLPYTEASQSGVVAFACGAGLPVIATPVGGLPEQISHMRSGIVARSVDAAGIAEAVTAFLRDDDLYERCSRGALKLADGSLAWDRIAGKIGDILLSAGDAVGRSS